MANLILNNLPYFIQGDGVSLTAQINLGFSPISATFFSALITNTGANVTSNVASVVVAGQIATVTFNAAFSYVVTIILDILPVLPLLSGSVQVSTPWIMQGNQVTGTLATGFVAVGASDGGGNFEPLLSTVKGTQGAQGLAVQELKDAGRTQVTLYVDSISGITTEALATLNITKGNVAQATATSYTVTAGKTLRMQQFCIMGLPPTNASVATRSRVRVAASGITVASPILINAVCAGSTNQAFAAEPEFLTFPDGIEVAGGNQVAISHISSATMAGSTTTGAGVSFCLIGYEY
jgi:hypothetical protein